MRNSNRPFIPANDYIEINSPKSFAGMNDRFDLHIITQSHSQVYCGYFRRLVYGNSWTFSHIPPCLHAKPPNSPRRIGPRVITGEEYEGHVTEYENDISKIHAEKIIWSLTRRPMSHILLIKIYSIFHQKINTHSAGYASCMVFHVRWIFSPRVSDEGGNRRRSHTLHFNARLIILLNTQRKV